MNPLGVRSAIVASLGGLIFGFDTAVISGTTEALKEVFHLHHDALRDDGTEQVPTRTGARPDGSHTERMEICHPVSDVSPASW